METKIKTLFLDIGQVLLTNGWDRYARQKAVEKFGLDKDELSDRHHIFFETYEMGKLSLAEYLEHVIFYEPRSFTTNEFTDFILSQSGELDGSIKFFKALKKKYGFNIASINNEGCELNEHRIKAFNLDTLFDTFISSCYVHLRKPDKEIFRMACAVTYTKPAESLFIDDRSIHVQIARSLGMNAIQFTGLEATREALLEFGLSI